LYFLGTGSGLLEKQAQELHVLRLLVSLLDSGLLEKTSTGASRTQATCSLLDGGLLENKHRSFTYSGYLFYYWTVDY
jgi:hypothetical protein